MIILIILPIVYVTVGIVTVLITYDALRDSVQEVKNTFVEREQLFSTRTAMSFMVIKIVFTWPSIWRAIFSRKDQ